MSCQPRRTQGLLSLTSLCAFNIGDLEVETRRGARSGIGFVHSRQGGCHKPGPLYRVRLRIFPLASTQVYDREDAP
jgi:hypothetical protein